MITCRRNKHHRVATGRPDGSQIVLSIIGGNFDIADDLEYLLLYREQRMGIRDIGRAIEEVVPA